MILQLRILPLLSKMVSLHLEHPHLVLNLIPQVAPELVVVVINHFAAIQLVLLNSKPPITGHYGFSREDPSSSSSPAMDIFPSSGSRMLPSWAASHQPNPTGSLKWFSISHFF